MVCKYEGAHGPKHIATNANGDIYIRTADSYTASERRRFRTIKGSFVFSKMTLEIILANKNLYKLTNDSGREFFLGVIPGKTNGA